MKTLLIFGISLLTTSAFAGPIYSSNCASAKEIQNPSTATGFYMSGDCKTAYVLPPKRGITTIIGHTSGDLGRCKEVLQFNSGLKKINTAINKALGTANNEAEIKSLYDQRKLTIEQYSDLSRTQGAAIELSFSNGIIENIQAYQELNSHVNVNFTPVALKDMKLAWNQVEKLDPEMKIAFNQSVPLPSMDDVGVGSFNARLDLSLFGACPLMDPFTKKFPKNLKVKNLAGLITPNVVYHYELGATYKYKASYNLAALASKFKENSSSGGLFKTSTMSKLIEDHESKGWFNLEMSCDDSRVCDQAKMETASSIKLRLMKEVLDNIALTTVGYNMTPTAPGTPGASGAQTGAEALRKCPNIYCQAGAIILDVAQSIFGGTSATETFIKKNNHTALEEVTENRPVLFTGMMGFGQ